MKTTLFSLFLTLLCLCGSALGLRAQGGQTPLIIFTSIQNGDWQTPGTWQSIGPNGFSTTLTPADNANNTVIINHDITLNMDYAVTGLNGTLIINTTGSLAHAGQYTLSIGDRAAQGGGRAEPRLNVLPRLSGVSLNLYKLNFYKAAGTIDGAIQTASCVTFSNNSDLTFNLTSSLTVNGNLLIEQGNSSVNSIGIAAGALTVLGRVLGIQENRFQQDYRFATYNIQNRNFDCSVAVPLPVELVSFTAKHENQQVAIRWATASEKDAANFAVERSTDGKNFATVTTVPAAGTSATRREYETTDRSMPSGLNYYRLKQTDLDGTFTYSQVLPVQVGELAPKLEAYGAQGTLNIVMQTPGTLQQLRVLDTMGRVLYTETLSGGATGLITRKVPVSGGVEGRVYLVQAVTSQGVISKKFVSAN
ncbi:hypothetical protein [Hymenobacter sp.]|jgi:hypothetical protein|uniref:hypothetical protein n=1 Tax=Hymenobacter sp. TaxID=1898978 RepID=UPI002ED9F0F9